MSHVAHHIRTLTETLKDRRLPAEHVKPLAAVLAYLEALKQREST